MRHDVSEFVVRVVVDELGEEDVREILDAPQACRVGLEVGGLVGQDDAPGLGVDLMCVNAGHGAQGVQAVVDVFGTRRDEDA